MNLIEEIGFGNYYLYCYVRLDTNKPFYIGIGTKIQRGNKSIYQRAFSKAGRNKYWKHIVNRHPCEVNILLESNSYDFIKQKEIEFIALYGRKDIGQGSLVNVTNGGEGIRGYKMTKEHIEKWKLSRKKYRPSPETKFKQSLSSHLAKKAFEYSLDGTFLKEWRTVTEACLFYCGKKKGSIARAIRGQKKDYKSHNRYWSFDKLDFFKPPPVVKKKRNINLEKFQETWRKKSELIEVVCIKTGCVSIWESAIDFLRDNPKFSRKGISACCTGKKRTHLGHTFKYLPKNVIKSNQTNL